MDRYLHMSASVRVCCRPIVTSSNRTSGSSRKTWALVSTKFVPVGIFPVRAPYISKQVYFQMLRTKILKNSWNDILMKMCRMHLKQFTSHDFQSLGIIFFHHLYVYFLFCGWVEYSPWMFLILTYFIELTCINNITGLTVGSRHCLHRPTHCLVNWL